MTFPEIVLCLVLVLREAMAAVVWWHADPRPALGFLKKDCVRAVEGSSLSEHAVCEGFYEYEEAWFPCFT